jgi:predicted transcriptional regulator
MKAMNYTSSLPEELIEMLDTYARKFKMPKNRIMEQALRAYFEKLKKAEYAHSFRRAASDEEQVLMAEEGLEDYLKIISEE